MGSVVNFADAVRNLIQAGQTVQEGDVIRIVSDNGGTIGNAVRGTASGGNGVASNVYSMTGEVVGGTATTTGSALITVGLQTAAAAIAPCLGVAAGYGLYNLSPAFWESVANRLYDSDQTLGRNVIAWFSGRNIGFSQQTIEIFKNALIEAGLFEMTYHGPSIDTENQQLILGTISVADSKALCIKYISQISNIPADYKQYAYNFINGYSGQYPLMVQHYYYKEFAEGRFSLNVWEVYNAGATVRYSTPDPNGWSGLMFSGTRVFRTTAGGYYGDGAGFEFNINNPSMEFRWQDVHPDDYSGVDRFFPIFGDFEPNPDLQPDATYPNADDPFNETYPSWKPWIGDFPIIYPVKYPEIEPDPYPDQEGAQDPEPEPDTALMDEIIDFFDLPYPWDWDTPIPEPEPDPDPEDEEEEIEDDDQVDPGDDPADPNDEPDDGTPTPIPDLPTTVASTALFTVYNPTEAELNSLGAFLWNNSIMESVKKIWQDPLDGLISLIKVYATPSAGTSKNIVLGYLDSGVSSHVVTSQFVTVDCGSVQLKEKKLNATDYSPYTSLHVFLPFIGITELDVNECMNATIGIKYKVDVYTGTCLAEITITRAKDMANGAILYTFSGNCSQQIPLTSGNASGILGSMVSAVGLGLAIGSGGGVGVVAGANMVGHSLTHEMFHVSHSGNISANAGILGGRKPYLIVGRRHNYDANNYARYYGFPSNKTVRLGNTSGYVRVKDIFVQTTGTQSENEEIVELLKAGVIF